MSKSGGGEKGEKTKKVGEASEEERERQKRERESSASERERERETKRIVAPLSIGNSNVVISSSTQALNFSTLNRIGTSAEYSHDSTSKPSKPFSCGPI